MLTCLQNPTTHYNSDGGLISGNPLTWIDKGTTKSIYDPCPYGYRVPINGTWVGFTVQTWNNGDIKGGSVWQSTWWPAAGYRSYYSATMGNVAYGSYYWSSSFYNSPTYHLSHNLDFGYTGSVSPSFGSYRSNGFALRCVQE